MKKVVDLISEADQVRLGIYDLHHMHHFLEKDQVMHDLHHCPLFSRPGMKGKEFSQDHLLIGQKLYHIILGNHPSVVYDHADKSYTVQKKEIRGRKYYIITGYYGRGK